MNSPTFSSRRIRVVSLSTLFMVVLAAVSSRSVASERPHIVLIVLDDAGYSDLGVFGSEISTPNIDSLSSDGVQFTQFHVTPNGPSKTTIADYLELDGAGAEFLKQFNNRIDNRGLTGSNVDLGPGWAYGLAAPLRLMKGYQSQGGVLSPLIIKAPPVGT